MEQPPDGPEGGEPFPTFDPSFTTPERRPRPQQKPAPPPQQKPAPPPQQKPAPPPKQKPAPRPKQKPAPRQPAPRPTGGGGTRGRPPATQANPVLVGIAVGLVLATISVVVFFMLTGGDETVAITTTTSQATTTTTDASASTSTTAGTGTTDTTAPGAVTIPDGTDTKIAPVGLPIPISELTMTSNDIGPLDFGADADEVLGRLAATFGQPTDDTGFIVGSGSFGECPGESIRVVSWGPLRIVVKGESSNATFVSYRLDLRYGGITSNTTDIATKSGLRVGDTVGTMLSIYKGYVIEYPIDQDVGLTFELRASQNDALPLLWGPIESQAEDSRVTGIYSPDSCAQEAAG